MTPLVVRVLPDVAAIDKTFDYLVPDELRDEMRVGDMVRVELHGRRVGGWITALDVDPPSGVALRALAKRRGVGPDADLIDLARWAAWRWAGRPASLLKTASPPRAVRQLAAATPPLRPPAPEHALLGDAFAGGPQVLELSPATNLVHVALAAASLGHALVVCPTATLARTIATHLRAAGVDVAEHPAGWARGASGATVVGARSAVWARVAGLAAIVVLDEHDEAHQQEQTPTWHAREVAMERASRAGIPCVLTSPCPTLEARGCATLRRAERGRERAGWPAVTVVDRRDDDPRTGLLSSPLVDRVRSPQRVLCVLNRTGRARLLACGACGDLARCEVCAAAVTQPEGDLHCRRCGANRPPVCLTCGASRFRSLQPGVSRVREDLAALAGEPVGEVTAASGDDIPAERVLVGTEAVLQRIPSADVVAFLDLDQELLAPRYRAAEHALALVARAARVVAASGPPRQGRAAGLVVLQTRLPGHEVVQAAVRAEPSLVSDAELTRRQVLRLPPVSALAQVSGPVAAELIDGLAVPPGVEVVAVGEGRWWLRASSSAVLSDLLATAVRPSGRLRIEVDPLRV